MRGVSKTSQNNELLEYFSLISISSFLFGSDLYQVDIPKQCESFLRDVED
jgi:hypothetical protein